jgi:hypothetical protein
MRAQSVSNDIVIIVATLWYRAISVATISFDVLHKNSSN